MEVYVGSMRSYSHWSILARIRITLTCSDGIKP